MRRVALALLLLAVVFGRPAPASQATLPARPDSLKLAAIGDNGTGDRAEYEVGQAMATIRAQFPFELVIMLGDNMYGRQQPQDFVTKFERPYAALLAAGVTFYASLGNHDNQSNMRYEGFHMGGARYYTFARSNARFFVLDSNVMDPVQLAWIDSALKQSTDDWKICYFHHPIYSSGGRHGSDVQLRVALEPLFAKYGVNVVLSGHDHTYERFKPQKGVTYFVSGASGSLAKGNVRPSPETAAFFDQDQSFMLLEIAGDDLFFQAVSRTGLTVDSGVVRRQPTGTGAMTHHAAHASHVLGHPAHRRWSAPRIGHHLHRHLLERFLLFPLGVTIALVWANSGAESYFTFAEKIAFPVNEVGMAFFFALATQEIVEAAMPGGALHSWRRWVLPIIAAAGGVIGSATVYLTYVRLSYETVLVRGWPIACAVDVAAAYYLLKTIFPRSGALPFALLIGIATDIFGVLVVAPRSTLFGAHAGGAALILVAIGLAGLMRALGLRAFWPYFAISGTLSWLAFLWSGLHPAFALVPIVPFLPHKPRRLDLFADPPDDNATHHFEHEWTSLVQGILFLFALVNAGVVLRGYDTGTWAVLAAALLGRPAGILAAVGLAVLGGMHLPKRIGWRELVVVALATSSGFTIGLFFATGVLAIGPVLAQLTIGALATGAGLLLALGAARLLHTGRFAS